MRYVFEQYLFDASQQLLFKDDKTIPLKRNEARLLQLFLSRPKEVLSKEVILNEVWGERVVSEQVVFQNISQLRTIFSDKAIKTFPMKGYQWQFEVQSESPKEMSSSTKIDANSGTFIWASVAIALFITLTSFLFLDREGEVKADANKIKVTLIPFASINSGNTNEAGDAVTQVLLKSNGRGPYDLIEPAEVLTTRSFFNAPILSREKLNLDEQELLLSGFVTAFDDGLLLRYRLQGPQRDWAGYLFAPSKELLAQQLTIALTRILDSKLLSLTNEALVLSELTLLHNQYPDDHSILLRLIIAQASSMNYDIAMALVDKLITQSSSVTNTAYLGLGYMLKGKIYHLQNFLDRSEGFYKKAHVVLAKRSLHELQTAVSKNEGWLGFARGDYNQVKTALFQAATQAKLANETLAEVEAFTLLSILASKLGQDKDKYDHLYKARSLLKEYQLHQSNFAVIYYHFALFAESEEESKAYYEKILTLPYKQDNAWIIEDVQKHLAQYHLKHQQWQQALDLFPDIQSSPFSFNQRAQIYNAMGRYDQALEHVQLAFSQARLLYNREESLNAALLLYRMSIQTEDVAGEMEYRDFIEKNAYEIWLSRHHDALKSLGYFTDKIPH